MSNMKIADNNIADRYIDYFVPYFYWTTVIV